MFTPYLPPQSISTNAQYVCDPALEILDEVDQPNPVNWLEDCWDPEKMHNFSEPWRSPGRIYKHSQIVFFDCSPVLID
jgi:hypothetical protein